MEEILQFLRTDPTAWSLVIIGVAAALEYMVPPLPADSVVLAGALLVVAGAWPFGAVLAAAVAGGFVGSVAHYLLGRALIGPDGSLRGGRYVERLVGRGSMDRFFEVFRRYGIWVIALNRMFPGIRAAAFLAAGAARLPPAPTLLLGLFSNVVWSFAILGLGVLIGGNLEKLRSLVGVYQTIAGGVLVLAALATYLWWRRRRRENR